MNEDDTFDELKYNVTRNNKGVFYYNGNGKLHRDNDQPAVILHNGYQYWFKNGKRHRDNDQPAVIRADGSKEWWVNGELIKLLKLIRSMN